MKDEKTKGEFKVIEPEHVDKYFPFKGPESNGLVSKLLNSDFKIESTWGATIYVAFNFHFGLPLLVAFFTLILFLYAYDAQNILLVLLCIVLFYALLIYLNALRALLNRLFFEDYAKKHGLILEPVGDVSNLKSQLFNIGVGNRMTDVLTLDFEGFPMKIFNYSYVYGVQKKNIRRLSVSEITFDKVDFPYMLLHAKSMSKNVNHKRIGNSDVVKVPLESDFSDYYEIMTLPGYGIEVLQIFSKDLLSYLINQGGAHLSIEFSGNRIYIYDDFQIGTESELDFMFAVTKKIIEKNAQRLERLHDDFDALHPYYKDRNK